jgi:hypothetical protein
MGGEVTAPDHQARLAAALAEIAGEPVGHAELLFETTNDGWAWSWRLGDSGAHGFVPGEEGADGAIAAACRTLRAALGLPDAGKVTPFASDLEEFRAVFGRAVKEWGEATCGSDDRWFIADAVASHYAAKAERLRAALRGLVEAYSVVRNPFSAPAYLIDPPEGPDAWQAALDALGPDDATDDAAMAPLTDKQAVAAKLFDCLWLYGNYEVDSRGPRGLLLDAIEALAPELAEPLRDGEDLSDIRGAFPWLDPDEDADALDPEGRS